MKKKLFPAILQTGLVAGLLDGLAAIIQFYINGGKNPAAIFKFIASGVFGKKAFAAGGSMVAGGVFFHFLVAFLFTAFFFWLCPRIKWIGENRILAGVIYGLFVWVVMNQLVVPLSNTPPLPETTVLKKVVSMLILVFCVGLPVSWMANRYYLYKK